MTYQRTHPWITYQLDLNYFSFKTWLLSGEAQSKCEHIESVPLMPGFAEILNELFLAEGVCATTQIEGNTLTIEEVKNRIKGELKLPPSREYLGLEIDNIVDACNRITNNLLRGNAEGLNIEQIKEYNAMILRGLNHNEDIIPGEIRKYDVRVGSYTGVSSKECSYLLSKLCDWINEDWQSNFEGYEVAAGIIKAILAHIYLVWIHPFGDGNGRTARLIELQVLLSLGLPSATTHLLSNHYNKTRTEYYRHLEIASNETNGIYRFIEYALQGFIDGLKEQIAWIEKQQQNVHWINYIHEVFKNKKGKADERRRHLAVDLANTPGPIPLDRVQLISKRIYDEYKDKVERTIHRDIKILEGMGLIEITNYGLRSPIEKILAFKSPTTKDK
ncbi:Fic family protein [bacterium]|nr:Fic family protein [bacterium]MBU1025283.1 Fic family protein [bacterium]